IGSAPTAHKKIMYVTVSRDEAWGFTCGEDGTVRRWRIDPLAEAGIVLTAYSGKVDESGKPKTEPVWMVTVSGDGSRILAGSNSGQIVSWQADGTVKMIGDCGESCAGLAFLPRVDR